MTLAFPLASSSWDQEEYDAMQRVILSKNFSMGVEVATFEKEFAAQFGSGYAVMVNSGSSANLLMVAALRYTEDPEKRIYQGDEIIVPAIGWSTSYAPLAQYGLKLKFVDVDIETLNYDLEALKSAISDTTRAIMVINLLGNPHDFDSLYSIIGDRNIIVIEDNCESMGATYLDKQTGTFGLMGSFSCFYSHHISTMEGGVVVTDDEELYHVMLSLRAHGWTRNLPMTNHVTGTKSHDFFHESFHFVLPGYNLRPLELSGAIGCEQLKKMPSLLAGRRRNAELMKARFVDHSTISMQKETGCSSWFGFSLLLKPSSSVDRGCLIKALNTHGFECRPIVSGNFTKNPVMKYYNYEVHEELANADYIDSRGLFIGNHHYDMSLAVDALDECLASLT